jgi:hypothetical protein
MPKKNQAEIAVLKRLRRMLMRRIARIEIRFEQADRQRNVFLAAELDAEKHGVSWAIHDLDYIVINLRK